MIKTSNIIVLLALCFLFPVSNSPAIADNSPQIAAVSYDIFDIGEDVNVIGKKVNLRKYPDLKSKVLAQLNEPMMVTIVQKGKMQKIGKWGKNYWYFVKFTTKQGKWTGWLFGAFLERIMGC